jgi:hypothetical protein
MPGHNEAAGSQEQGREENRTPGHAPGPQIHQAAPEKTQQKLARFNTPEVLKKPLPPAEVQHPEQHSRIMPTPQGWQRTPAAHPPQAHETPHPAGGQDQRRPNEER